MSKFKKTKLFYCFLPMIFLTSFSCSRQQEIASSKKTEPILGQIKNKKYKLYWKGGPTKTEVKVGQILALQNLKDWGFSESDFGNYSLFKVHAIKKNEGEILIKPLKNDFEEAWSSEKKPIILEGFEIEIRESTKFKTAWNNEEQTLNLSELKTIEEFINLLISRKNSSNFEITKLKSEKNIVNLILPEKSKDQQKPYDQQEFKDYLNSIKDNVKIKLWNENLGSEKSEEIVFDLSREKTSLIESIDQQTGHKTQQEKREDQMKNGQIIQELLSMEIITQLVSKIDVPSFIQLSTIDHAEFKAFKDFVKGIDEFLDKVQQNSIFETWVENNYLNLDNFKGNFLFEVINGE